MKFSPETIKFGVDVVVVLSKCLESLSSSFSASAGNCVKYFFICRFEIVETAKFKIWCKNERDMISVFTNLYSLHPVVFCK